MTKTEHALIVAGGKGTRMNTPVPKQYLELDGKPVLLHTLEAFFRYSDKIQIVLVLPEGDFPTWNEMAAKHNFNKPVVLQSGGDSRFQSVKKGLEKMRGDGLVAIHDAVRPLVTESIIGDSFRCAARHGSAVASVKLKDSVRQTQSDYEGAIDKTIAVDRSRFRLIQTPQTFEIPLISRAYLATEDSSLTDDASVAERSGLDVFLFEGSYENIKITTQEDFMIAEAILRARRKL